jgi:hypothetical protein
MTELNPKEKALVRIALGNMEREMLKRADKARNNDRATILTGSAYDFAALKELFK